MVKLQSIGSTLVVFFLFLFPLFPIPTARNEALGIGLLLPSVRMEGVSCLQQEQNYGKQAECAPGLQLSLVKLLPLNICCVRPLL